MKNNYFIQTQFFYYKNKVVYLDKKNLEVNVKNGFSSVLVKVIYCGICNSDIKEICGIRLTRNDFGHECLGQVVNSYNSDLQNGTYVTLDPHILIQRNTCFSNYTYMMSEKYLLEKALFQLPSSDTKFVLTEPLACAIHLVNRILSTKIKYKKILIYGAGTFGYLIYKTLEFYGFEVYLGNRSNDRLHNLVSLVGNLNLVDDNSSTKFDAVIFSSSNITFSEISSLFYKMNNTIDIFLFAAIQKNEPFDLYEIRNKELIKSITYQNKKIRFIGSLGSLSIDFIESIKLLNKSEFCDSTKKIITDVFSPNDGLIAINNMVNGVKYFGKSIINFS